MKCVIPGTNVKVFGRAVHSLSKIGDELYFEPLDHGLALRTVNSSRSAYASFIFATSFFAHYDDGAAAFDSEDSEAEILKCKIGMKSCLTVFKSLSTLEKTVEKCKITLNIEEARLIFQMHCRHGIVKTHNLAFIECETLQAVFSRDLCPNVLASQTRLLCEAVVNFQTTQEEVSLIVDPQQTKLKNYVEDEVDPNKVVHTELSLSPEEFETYQIGIDTEVTFCLKELRAILAFTEQANLPISIHFETSGKPIVFCVDSDPTFEANFVLATLADSKSAQNCSQSSLQENTRNIQPASVQKQQKYQTNGATNNRKRERRKSSDTEQEASVHHARQGGGDGEIGKSYQKSRHRDRNSRKAITAKFDAAYQEFLNDDMDDLMDQQASFMENINVNTESASNKPKESRKQQEIRPSTSRDDTSSPVLAPIKFNKSTAVSHEMQDSDTEEEDSLIPGTPPSKKFKSSFFGLSQSTVSSTQRNDELQTTKSRKVLVADSDEESD